MCIEILFGCKFKGELDPKLGCNLSRLLIYELFGLIPGLAQYQSFTMLVQLSWILIVLSEYYVSNFYAIICACFTV